jgi:carbonic anhydrase
MAAGPQNGASPLSKWLESAGDTFKSLDAHPELAPERSRHDRLAQAHALVQLEHLKTHAPVAEALEAGRLRLHAWWFDLALADVHAWEPELGRYTLLDEAEAARILERLGR